MTQREKTAVFLQMGVRLTPGAVELFYKNEVSVPALFPLPMKSGLARRGFNILYCRRP
jgi:hypothetical protein